MCLKFGVCNWLLMFAIDFWGFQLSLLKAHDPLQQSQLEKFLRNFGNSKLNNSKEDRNKKIISNKSKRKSVAVRKTGRGK